MKTALYPGTFDPITYGHLDIVQRACELFDEVIITVAVNVSKKPLFTVEERVSFATQSVAQFPNARVSTIDGLVVDFAKNAGAIAIIRGLRAISDFDYEFQMALMNRKLAASISTVFLMPHEKYTYLNSTIIRNLAQFGCDVSEFVPPCVQHALKAKYTA